MSYLTRAQELYEQMVQDRRYLHQYPEVGMDLPETTNYVMKRLTDMGYQPQMLGGGVTAAVTGNPNGKVFLLRADMDACVRRAVYLLPLSVTVHTPAATTCIPPCCLVRHRCLLSNQNN